MGRIYGNVELNSHGVNKKISANILEENIMREIGFSDWNKDVWYYSRMVKFPSKYSDFEVSFSVSIPKDGSEIRIDVLDEAFCQPYDYQKILEKDEKFECAVIVDEFVEKHMEFLQEKGVLTGHIKGEYI